ncbi:glycosyltransferase family 4 protein [Thermodesulfobacteriota bacterium]
MKIRILFVIDNLQFGGGERVFSQIINGLDPYKYHIFLASLPDGHFYKSITNNQVKYLPLDFLKRVNPRLILQLKKIIKRKDIQIVHGQGTRAEFYARVATRLAGKAKYVSTIAMPVEGFDVGILRKKIYRLFDRFSERYVDRFIVVSDALKDMMINKRGIFPEKVVRIYNGIEIDRYSSDNVKASRLKVREEFKINENDFLIGAIGRLVWQKGFECLIRAIPSIIKSYPNSKLLIVGDGPLKDRLKEQGKRLRVKEYLIFTGFRDNIKEILSAIDILVIPSLLEGFPMITLEAMAMAKPIIATNIEGIKEQLIDSESGLLIPPGDEHAVSQAFVKIVEDKMLSGKLGSNARKRVVEEFSVQRMINETEKVYIPLIQIR